MLKGEKFNQTLFTHYADFSILHNLDPLSTLLPLHLELVSMYLSPWVQPMVSSGSGVEREKGLRPGFILLSSSSMVSKNGKILLHGSFSIVTVSSSGHFRIESQTNALFLIAFYTFVNNPFIKLNDLVGICHLFLGRTPMDKFIFLIIQKVYSSY